MYEVRCSVKEAQLPSVLRALSGLTSGLPTVTVAFDEDRPAAEPAAPLRRGPYKPSKRKKSLVHGGWHRKGKGAIETMLPIVKALNVGDKFTSRQMRTAVEAVGYSQGAYSHGIKLLRDDGIIKPLGFGHYEVLKKPEQAAA